MVGYLASVGRSGARVIGFICRGLECTAINEGGDASPGRLNRSSHARRSRAASPKLKRLSVTASTLSCDFSCSAFPVVIRPSEAPIDSPSNRLPFLVLCPQPKPQRL